VDVNARTSRIHTVELAPRGFEQLAIPLESSGPARMGHRKDIYR